MKAVEGIEGAIREKECPDRICQILIEYITSNACVNMPIIDLYIQDNLREFQSTVDVVKWVSLLKQGNDYLKDTPQTVTSATRDIVWVMENQLEHIKKISDL